MSHELIYYEVLNNGDEENYPRAEIAYKNHDDKVKTESTSTQYLQNQKLKKKYLKNNLRLEKFTMQNFRYEESLGKIAESLKDISRKETNSDSSNVDKDAILSALKNFARKI